MPGIRKKKWDRLPRSTNTASQSLLFEFFPTRAVATPVVESPAVESPAVAPAPAAASHRRPNRIKKVIVTVSDSDSDDDEPCPPSNNNNKNNTDNQPRQDIPEYNPHHIEQLLNAIKTRNDLDKDRARRQRKSYSQKHIYLLLKAKKTKNPLWENAVRRVPRSTMSDWQKKGIEHYFKMSRTLMGGYKRIVRCKKYCTAFAMATSYYLAARDSLLGVSMKCIKEKLCDVNQGFKNLSERAQWRALARWRVRNNLCLRRKTGVTQLLPADHEKLVHEFFLRLRKWVCLGNKPSTIVFLDETAVFWDPSMSRVLATYGAKNVTLKTTKEKACSTVLLAGEVRVQWNDDGTYTLYGARHLPPHLVYEGTLLTPKRGTESVVSKDAKRFAQQYDITTAVTEAGWITEKTFLEWISKLPNVGNGWLIMDLYPAHHTKEVIKLLKSKGYTPWFIPGGCTSKIQIHDVMINKSYKNYVREWVNAQKMACVRKGKEWKPDRQTIAESIADAIKKIPVDFLVKGVEKCVLTSLVARGTATWDEMPTAESMICPDIEFAPEPKSKEEREAEKQEKLRKHREATAALKAARLAQKAVPVNDVDEAADGDDSADDDDDDDDEEAAAEMTIQAEGGLTEDEWIRVMTESLNVAANAEKNMEEAVNVDELDEDEDENGNVTRRETVIDDSDSDDDAADIAEITAIQDENDNI